MSPRAAAFSRRPLSARDAAHAAPILASLEPWSTLGFASAGLERHLSGAPDDADSTKQRWALCLDDALAGVAVVRAPWLRGPYLETIAVFPHAQGRGIGAGFLALMEADARAAHQSNTWLCVSAFNHAAQRFYARQGYTKVAHLDGLIRPDQDEHLMRKRLDLT
ncbi:MAG: GNAT family N-acetyltransferase [Pseudomonadota bacterium]